MSWPVFAKTMRDYGLLLLIASVALLAFQVLIVRIVLIEAARDLEMLQSWLELPLVRTIIKLALGDDLVGDITPTSLATIGLAHPFVYAVTWALLLALTTGALAGEIGRGTADLLLPLPVSRTSVYLSVSLAWLLACVPLSFVLPPGLFVGEMTFPIDRSPQYGRLWQVTVNLFVLNVSIAAVAMCISAIVSRRGVAVGVALAGLLASDVLNLVAQFWETAQPLSVLGFLHYYKPLPIVRTGEIPMLDVAVLLGVGGFAWGIGLWHFSRRDIPAV